MTTSESRCVRYGHDRIASVWTSIQEDIVRFATFSPEYRPDLGFKTRLSLFFKPAILCLFCYRIGHFLFVRRWLRLARATSILNFFVHQADIPSHSCIGPGCFLGHCSGASFHGTAGRNLTMFSLAICCPTAESFGGPAAAGPQLGDGVTIGGHAVLIGPVNIGNNVQIAPLTRVAVDCADNSVVVSARIRPTHTARTQTMFVE